MSKSNEDWVVLLHTAKQLRRGLRPVNPSPRFRQHLRSDLETALVAGRPVPSLGESTSLLSPGLLFALCLGTAVAALALIVLRDRALSRQPRQ